MNIPVMSTEAGFITALWLIKGFFWTEQSFHIFWATSHIRATLQGSVTNQNNFDDNTTEKNKTLSIWNGKKLGFINIPQIHLEFLIPFTLWTSTLKNARRMVHFKLLDFFFLILFPFWLVMWTDLFSDITQHCFWKQKSALFYPAPVREKKFLPSDPKITEKNIFVWRQDLQTVVIPCTEQQSWKKHTSFELHKLFL